MNDEFFNDNDLDRWLRESAYQQRVVPAPDGWDTPSGDVWQRLRRGLDERKKRRRFLWLWLLPALLLGSGAWWYGFYQPRRTGAGQIGNGPAAKITVAPQLKQPASNPDAEAAYPAAPAKPMTKEQTLNTKPVFPGPASTVLHGPAGGFLTVPPAPQPNAGSPFSTPLTVQTAPGTGPEAHETAPAVLTADTGGVSHAAAATNTQAGKTCRTEANIPDLLPSPAVVLSASSPVQWPAAPVVHPQSPALHWYVGAFSGMSYTARVLKSGDGKIPNGQESGAWTPVAGLQIGLPLARHWVLKTGLQSTAIRLQAQRTIRFTYQTNQEQYNAQDFAYRSTTDQNIETSFGRVQMRMVVNREPNRPIADQAVVELTLRTDEQAQYIRVPLKARWLGSAGRWQWTISGGLGFNFERQYELRLTAARANRPGLRNIAARQLRNRAIGLAPVLFDAEMDAGLQLRLTPRWSLRLGPEFRYGLNSLYRNGPFRALPVSGGFQFGLIWGG